MTPCQLFLPSHQSHLDYIIVHLVCSIPNGYSFGNCRRKLECCRYWRAFEEFGAIFIPRSFNNEAYTERNLNNVIEFILVNKIPFEVFIEGTRSEMGNCYYLNMVF